MNSDGSYKISELARLFGITTRTVRYYEELGLLEAQNRAEGKHRRYSGRNAIRLKRIQQLKDYGLTLSEIRGLFELAKRDRSGEAVRRSLAEKYRDKLTEAKRRLLALEAYIDDLSWHLEQLDKVQDFFECPGASCSSCRWVERCDVRAMLDREA